MYQILIEKKAERSLSKIPQKYKEKIILRIKELAKDPFARHLDVKKLQGRDGYRMRIGDYRVLYKVDKEKIIIYVFDAGHRRQIYQ